MSRKYIEARKTFSGLTSESGSSEDAIDMNGERITLTLKCPAADKFQGASSPTSSLGRHYLSLGLADHETGPKNRAEGVERCDLALERLAYPSSAPTGTDLLSVAEAGSEPNPFGYQALATQRNLEGEGAREVSPDKHAGEEGDGTAYDTPVTGTFFLSRTKGDSRVPESDFMNLRRHRQRSPAAGQLVVAQESEQAPFAHVTGSEERPAGVTEYTFMDVKSASQDSCPMLFGQKLRRIPPVESSAGKQDATVEKGDQPSRATAAESADLEGQNVQQLSGLPDMDTYPGVQGAPGKNQDLSPVRVDADTEASKESCSRPETGAPSGSSSVPKSEAEIVAGKDEAASGETEGKVTEQVLVSDKAVLKEPEVETPSKPKNEDQPAPVKRVGRIIKLPTSLVGGGNFDFDDRSSSRKRVRTGFDRDSFERDLSRTRVARDRVIARELISDSDVDDEVYGQGRSFVKEEDIPRHGRRVEYSPGIFFTDRSDDGKVAGGGPGRSVFNRLGGANNRDTVFDRLIYRGPDDMQVGDRDYKTARDRPNQDGRGFLSRLSNRGMHTATYRDRDHEPYRQHRGRGGPHHQASHGRDQYRSSEKQNYGRSFSGTDFYTASRDFVVANGKLQHSRSAKLSGWDRSVQRLSPFDTTADGVGRRSCSPDERTFTRSRKHVVHSPPYPAYPALLQQARQSSCSPPRETTFHRTFSRHPVAGKYEVAASSDLYSPHDLERGQQRSPQLYPEDLSAGRGASARARHEVSEAAEMRSELTDYWGSGKTYTGLSETSDRRNHSDASGRGRVSTLEGNVGMKGHVGRLEVHEDEKLVDYLKEFGNDSKNGRPGKQSTSKEWTGQSENGYSPDGSTRTLYNLNFGTDLSDGFESRRNKDVVNRSDLRMAWEQRESRHVATRTRDFTSSDAWPEERLQLGTNRYHEKATSGMQHVLEDDCLESLIELTPK